MRRIVLPQAIRVIISPTGNEFIGQLKNTSLSARSGFMELLTTVEIIYEATFQTIPLLLVAALWYLIVTTVLSIGQSYIERHFARGSRRFDLSQPSSSRCARTSSRFHAKPLQRTPLVSEAAP